MNGNKPWTGSGTRLGTAAYRLTDVRNLPLISGTRALYAAIFVVFIAWLVRTILLGPPVFPVDDAYITLHNAEVLHWGYDPNYRGVSPLAGATSSVHLALVAVLMTFLPPRWALYASLWLAALAYALGVARLAILYRANVAQAALLTAVALSVAEVPHQLMDGLEPGLAMAVLVWLLVLASERSEKKQRAMLVLCGVLPFIRPELVVVSALVFCLHAWRSWRAATGIPDWTRSLILDMLTVAAGAVPWMAWYIFSIGTPYPSTIAAKQYFYAEGCFPSHLKIQIMRPILKGYVRTIGLLSIGVLLMLFSPLGVAGLIFFAVFLYEYYARFPAALGFYEGRYLYVFIPFLLFGIASCFAHRLKLLRILSTLLITLLLIQSVKYVTPHWHAQMAYNRFTLTQLRSVAVWTNKHVPPGSTILIHDAGYIAYGTKFHLIDLVGLKTPSSIGYHKQLTWPSCGRKRPLAIARIALRNRPQYLIAFQPWNRDFGITASLQTSGWRVRIIRPRGVYQVYKLTPPG